MGPVVGLVGALQADLALSQIDGARDLEGELVTVDGRAEPARIVRRRRIGCRQGCLLCSNGINEIDRGRYVADACAEG